MLINFLKINISFNTVFLLISIFFMHGLLSGCSNAIKPTDLVNIERNIVNQTTSISSKKLQKLEEFNSDPFYQLDYLIDNDRYRYMTFSYDQSYRYLQVLTKNNRVIAVAPIALKEYTSPAIRSCTLFPLRSNKSVEDCFRQFNQAVLAKNNTHWRQALDQFDEEERERIKVSYVASASMLALYVPIAPVAAAIIAPLAVGDYLTEAYALRSIDLSLGTNANLQQLLDKLPAEHKSVVGKQSSAYIEAGVSVPHPVLAFGYTGNTIQWIQQNPFWRCRGFLVFRGDCSIGVYNVRH